MNYIRTLAMFGLMVAYGCNRQPQIVQNITKYDIPFPSGTITLVELDGDGKIDGIENRFRGKTRWLWLTPKFSHYSINGAKVIDEEFQTALTNLASAHRRVRRIIMAAEQE